MKKFNIAVASALVLIAVPLTAGALDKTSEAEMVAALEAGRAAYTGVTEAEYLAFKNLPDSNFDRKIATSGGLYEAEMSADYKAMGNRIHALRSTEELSKLIEELDNGYDGYKDADLKLLALETAQLRPLRGIIFKMIPLIEKAKVSHSMLLTKVMKIATHMSIYSPTIQSKLVMGYLSEPFDNMVRFTTPGSFQKYVTTAIFPATWKSALRLKELDLSQRKDGKGRQHRVVVDNSVFYSGIGGYYEDASSLNNSRFNFFQEGERQLLMAMKNRTMKDQNAFVAFNLDQLVDLLGELGKLYGMEATREYITGVSTKNIHDVLKMPKFSGMFTMYPNTGPAAMDNARFFTIQMVYHLGQAWKALKDDKGKVNLNAIVNAGAANAFADTFEDVLPAWEKMVKGPQPLVSKTTSEMVTVDILGYYDAFKTKSPSAAQMKARDLKNFLPTTFHITPNDKNCTEHKSVKVKGYSFSTGLGTDERDGMLSKMIKLTDENGKEYPKPIAVCYHDYLSGGPIGWDPAAYSVLYPGLTDGAKVGGYQRTLKQSNGGRLVANLIDWVVD